MRRYAYSAGGDVCARGRCVACAAMRRYAYIAGEGCARREEVCRDVKVCV